MRIRFLFPLILPLIVLSFVLACGDDDGDSTPTPSPSPSAEASASPTEGASPTPGDETPTPTSPVVATPSRSIPASADHVALAVLNVVVFLSEPPISGGVPQAVPCPYDATDGIIDCTEEGYGQIALDPVPTGADEWECRALLTPAEELFAASCTATDSSGLFWMYSVES